MHVNLVGLLFETEKFSSLDSRGGKRLYVCKSVGLSKSIV